MKLNMSLVCTAILGLVGAPVQAAILYSTAGSSYIQDFDSLPNTPTNTSVQATRPWTDDVTQTATNTSIPGWYLWHPVLQAEGGANGHQRIRYSSGNSNTGAFYSFGTNSTTDRALGMTSSNTMAAGGMTDNGESYYGARLTNGTGVTLSQFTLSYTGEQWRDGGAATPAAQSITFGYKVAAASIQDTGYTGVPALDFTSPVFANTGAGAAVDGNAVGNRLAKSATITGLNWLPGQDLWIRWTDLNDAGNDHGLAVDDLTFVADSIPEPASLGLAGIAILATLAIRRLS